MKKIILLSASLVLIVLIILMVGCGSSSSSSSATTTTATSTTTTTAATETRTISGNLYTGTINNRSQRSSLSGRLVLASATDPIANYTVAAIGTATSQIIFPETLTTTADGSFSIEAPSTESVYLVVLDTDNSVQSCVSFASNESGEAIMAISPEADVSLGQIVFESSSGGAVPTASASSSILDENSTARTTSNSDIIPVGVGNTGRGTGEAEYTGTLEDKIDGDTDGLPDQVDVDDDGDGANDGLDETPRNSNTSQVAIDGVQNTNFFQNLPKIYQNHPSYISGSFNTSTIDVGSTSIMALQLKMEDGSDPSLFSDVRVDADNSSSWVQAATISGSSGDYTGYPDAGTSWEAENYKLYQGTSDWQVWIVPGSTPEVGSTVRLIVTDATTGDQSYCIGQATYMFTHIPMLLSYTDSVSTKEGANLNLTTYTANENKFTYTGTQVAFSWIAPKDDLGNYLTSGITWSLGGITYYDSNGTITLESGAQSLTTDDGSLTETADATYDIIYSTTFTPTSAAFSYFKIDFTATSPAVGGGSASQLVQFKKSE